MRLFVVRAVRPLSMKARRIVVIRDVRTLTGGSHPYMSLVGHSFPMSLVAKSVAWLAGLSGPSSLEAA